MPLREPLVPPCPLALSYPHGRTTWPRIDGWLDGESSECGILGIHAAAAHQLLT